MRQPVTKFANLADYKNIHKDQTIIVCGCGTSLNALSDSSQYITIGVNDVGRLFDPTYLVVLNPKQQFKNDRYQYVESSQASAIFTQLKLSIQHPQIVRFKLGQRGGTDISNPNTLPYTRNSPYVALCLAMHMGAKRIGLIGVDFTNHHFFANTGAHSLNKNIQQINAEYIALNKMALDMGVEIANLSSESRLEAFNKMTIESLNKKNVPSIVHKKADQITQSKVFCVNYKFLACGDVFTTGLQHAAEKLGLNYQSAHWDDPQLPQMIAKFDPDLLLVIHGRKYIQKYRNRIRCKKSAIWLLDEPYEVDDTAKFSRYFDTVFINDPSTLKYHQNAHYLPVAFDPQLHNPGNEKRTYCVGFIGGYNKTRERYLLTLLEAGYLSYVVGGPWKDRRLQGICLSANISPEETVELYRKTEIVVNVFRDIHHYNRREINGISLNPRVYEALACGALVISENRDELSEVFPQLPVFSSPSELLHKVQHFLDHRDGFNRVMQVCTKQLKEHTYAQRLKSILELSMNKTIESNQIKTILVPNTCSVDMDNKPVIDNWSDYGGICEITDDVLMFQADQNNAPGSELGIVSNEEFQNVELSFSVKLGNNTCFIAKINQREKFDQRTNSYHLMCNATASYLAMHNQVFSNLYIRHGQWHDITLRHRNKYLELLINGRLVYTNLNNQLKGGYCFIGIKCGVAEVRNIKLCKSNVSKKLDINNRAKSGFTIEQDFTSSFDPTVSIITTVYERVECLENCLHSVANLNYRDFEHIIVADHPSDEVLVRIRQLVKQHNSGRIKLINLSKRYNDWGITPASVGVNLARGRYISFLSDDNGYTPDHLTNLLDILNRKSQIGFAYSSCQYDGRLVLNSSVPRAARIDLGQPLFRRDLFDQYFSNGLPFDVMAWDWQMIDTLMKHGVKWKHFNKPTFLFRLDKYLPSRQRTVS